MFDPAVPAALATPDAPPAPPPPMVTVTAPETVKATISQYSPAPPPPPPRVSARVLPPPPPPDPDTQTAVTPASGVKVPFAVNAVDFSVPPPAVEATVIVLPGPASVIVIFDPAVRTRELASVASVACVMKVCDRLNDDGRSAATRARNAGCAGAPLVGPAHTVLADSVALVIANVPEVVIGEPLMLNSVGTVMATLVTVPVPTPPGMSARTSARKVGSATPPEVGPAQTVFAVSVALPIVIVPAVVTGDPLIVSSAGTASPTLVTVPVPVTALVANVPMFLIETTV